MKGITLALALFAAGSVHAANAPSIPQSVEVSPKLILVDCDTADCAEDHPSNPDERTRGLKRATNKECNGTDYCEDHASAPQLRTRGLKRSGKKESCESDACEDHPSNDQVRTRGLKRSGKKEGCDTDACE